MNSDSSLMDTSFRPSNSSRPFVGCIVTFSHLSSGEKTELKKKIKSMGGIYSKELNKHVTHLITLDWSTPKSLKCRKFKKPLVMMPRWIDAVAKQSGPEILPANHPSFLIHRLPVFYGFNICITQVLPEKRVLGKQKVERNGGKYSGDFNPSMITHLILIAAEGKKYEIAKKFDSVKKVDQVWFKEALDCGIPPLEDDYPPKLKDEATDCQNNKRKSGDSFPSMSDFISCKKNKSNLFDTIIIQRRREPELDITPDKRSFNESLSKADGFESILKDLGNLRKNARQSNSRSNSSQEKTPQQLRISKSSQASDKFTESLPVLWEA